MRSCRRFSSTSTWAQDSCHAVARPDQPVVHPDERQHGDDDDQEDDQTDEMPIPIMRGVPLQGRWW